jgi:hypothetical protein
MKRAIEDAIWHTRCGAADVAGYMQLMFGDRIEQRRQLLATAARESLTASDTQGMSLRMDEGSGSVLRPPSVPSVVAPPPRKKRNGLVGGLVVAIGVTAGLAAGIMIVRAGKSSGGAQASTLKVDAPVAKADETKPAANKEEPPAPAVALGVPMSGDLLDEGRLRPEHQLAEVLADAKRPDRSDRERTERTEKDRKDAMAVATEQYKKGTELYLAGDLTGAEVAYRAALAAVPGYAAAYKGLGILYQRQGNTARAADAYRRYLALAPKASDAESIRERIEQLGGE